ncbi:MAG: SUMF1/EgtB/PvdO family nonheme iron enzyme [Deltaproteobacteria bacterium]|nr:SUMF1/EgtB/PvdO family nonheme iron enzyme [Deltaproteobacteria bacterium]
MILVAAGLFDMGDDASPDASPRHPVELAAYRIDRVEVSIDRFEAFVAAGGYAETRWWSEAGREWLAEHPDGVGAAARASKRAGTHPVVAVSFWEAEAYCRAQGGDLPTEAQWERGACGPGRFPWGEGENVDAAWFTQGKGQHLVGVNTRAVDDAAPRLLSPLGLAHMAGNVLEWTRDTYHVGYDGGTAKDPIATTPSPWRVARGGSFLDLPAYATCTHREPVEPGEPRLTLGFRCAYPP